MSVWAVRHAGRTGGRRAAAAVMRLIRAGGPGEGKPLPALGRGDRLGRVPGWVSRPLRGKKGWSLHLCLLLQSVQRFGEAYNVSEAVKTTPEIASYLGGAWIPTVGEVRDQVNRPRVPWAGRMSFGRGRARGRGGDGKGGGRGESMRSMAGPRGGGSVGAASCGAHRGALLGPELALIIAQRPTPPPLGRWAFCSAAVRW